MIQKYTVFVDDNFHHGDEDERYELGEFNDYESAVTASKKLIDDYLLEVYEKGIKGADELYQKYITYGEDPFVVPDDGKFSGWDYAKERCQEVCRKELHADEHERKKKKVVMSSGCISCKSEIAIEPAFIIEQTGIPPGKEGHNIAYSHIILGLCSQCQSGQIENLRHDCFDFEDVWDQYEWYVIDRSDMGKLLTALKSCATPLYPDCKCKIHNYMRSEVGSLPTSSWDMGLEHDLHIHKVSLEIKNGLPRLKTR